MTAQIINFVEAKSARERRQAKEFEDAINAMIRRWYLFMISGGMIR